ncbi:serine hydrolase, partial [bacterium]|nr:serine hydrolase [bacterium]
ISFCIIQAQTQKGLLNKGETERSEIDSGEKHIYAVNMDKDQFALIRVNQINIDLKIATNNPENELLEKIDGPEYGYEYVKITSIKKGKYTIEISPFSKDKINGVYEVVLDTIKPKAVTPENNLDELFMPWNTKKTPGAAIAIIKDGKTIFEKAYGMANLEYGLPITTTSIFDIASVSKQFTAFAILLLEKEGKLSLDDNVKKYIPEFPDFGDTITIRHLITHTSGIRDYLMLQEMSGMRDEDYSDNEQVLKLINKQKDLNFKPGDSFSYSNSGFVILTEIVKRVSGKSFATYTKENIFEPLKMKSTFFPEDFGTIIKNSVESYDMDNAILRKLVSASVAHGDGALLTNVEDLCHWVLNFSEPVVGDTSIFNKMKTHEKLNNGQQFAGGYGQFVGEYRGLNEITHGGYNLGFRTQIIRFPDQNMAVIFLGNTREFNPEKISHEIADIYLEEYLKKDLMDDLAEKDVYQIDAEILKLYEGSYELRPGFVVNFSKNGNMLLWESEKYTFNLTPISDTKFNAGVVTAEFILDEKGKAKAFIFDNTEDTVTAPIIPFDKNNVNLSEFTGRFYNEELITTYDFKVVNGKLIAEHLRIDIKFDAYRKDGFIGLDDYKWLKISFVRNQNNEITGCSFSGDRARNVYFEKK